MVSMALMASKTKKEEKHLMAQLDIDSDQLSIYSCYPLILNIVSPEQGCNQPQKKGADTILIFQMWGLWPPNPLWLF